MGAEKTLGEILRNTFKHENLQSLINNCFVTFAQLTIFGKYEKYGLRINHL